MPRCNSPEHSALTPAGLHVLSASGRDAPLPVGEASIAITIAPSVICIAPIPTRNAPLVVRYAMAEVCITRAGF